MKWFLMYFKVLICGFCTSRLLYAGFYCTSSLFLCAGFYCTSSLLVLHVAFCCTSRLFLYAGFYCTSSLLVLHVAFCCTSRLLYAGFSDFKVIKRQGNSYDQHEKYSPKSIKILWKNVRIRSELIGFLSPHIVSYFARRDWLICNLQ